MTGQPGDPDHVVVTPVAAVAEAVATEVVVAGEVETSAVAVDEVDTVGAEAGGDDLDQVQVSQCKFVYFLV